MRSDRVIVDRQAAENAGVEYSEQGPELNRGTLALVKGHIEAALEMADGAEGRIMARGLEILLENYRRGC